MGEEDDNKMDLPPGFRFHPTDEELIHQYLYKKVLGIKFSSKAIGEVDLNKSEPWELPWKAKMGEKEWYFFCVRDRKYPTGLRTNRATDSGYWKATGKDKEIYKEKSLVGMKKTLVFYKGRAPKGVKSNWVMHEYRLDGNFSIHNLPKTAKNEWVICRVFQKGPDGKKTHISSLVNEPDRAGLPPLMDSSPYINGGKIKPDFAQSPYVSCFSNLMNSQSILQNTIDHHHDLKIPLVSSISSQNFPQIPVPNSFHAANFQFQGSVSVQEQWKFRDLIENHGLEGFKTGLSIDINPEISSLVSNLGTGKKPFDDQQPPCSSARPVDLDCFWHY